jgi:NAD(P)-dependent dehydrogenase (short-subunit alcohol dehydrogenase family)
MHAARRLLADGHDVVGLDNLNAYYDPRLKEARIAALKVSSSFQFEKIDIADRKSMTELFAAHRFANVVHLAAQAGVRHSLTDPHAYADANLTGFLNVLEGCRHTGCRHLVYASSSSVYGANTRVPFRATDNVDHPLSFYGATKKANELMAHAYAHLFALPATGLRFFTVYGPWGRPDMAMWLFTDAILQGRPIKLFNHGQMRRDFTYVVRRRPRSGDKPGTLACLQYRQQSAGRGDRGRQADRGGRRQAGEAGILADAARRCSRDLCRCDRSRARRRVPAQDTDRGGGPPLCRMVLAVRSHLMRQNVW